MCLVKNHGAVALEIRIVHGFPQEHAVRHVLKERGSALRHIFKSDRVAHFFTKPEIHFF